MYVRTAAAQALGPCAALVVRACLHTVLIAVSFSVRFCALARISKHLMPGSCSIPLQCAGFVAKHTGLLTLVYWLQCCAHCASLRLLWWPREIVDDCSI